MFLFVLLPLLMVLGMILIVVPAILPFAVIGLAVLAVARFVNRHHGHQPV